VPSDRPAGPAWNDLVYRLVPRSAGHSDVAGFLLWNHTCFPFGSLLQVARGLRQFERQRRGGWSNCSVCGNPYRHAGSVLVGGTCGEGLGCLTLDAAIAERGAQIEPA